MGARWHQAIPPQDLSSPTGNLLPATKAEQVSRRDSVSPLTFVWDYSPKRGETQPAEAAAAGGEKASSPEEAQAAVSMQSGWTRESPHMWPSEVIHRLMCQAHCLSWASWLPASLEWSHTAGDPLEILKTTSSQVPPLSLHTSVHPLRWTPYLKGPHPMDP